MDFNFKPIVNKILAEPLYENVRYEGGILIPVDRVRENLKRLKVLAKGDLIISENFVKGKEKEHNKINEKIIKLYDKVNKDDIVIIKPFAGTEIRLKGKTYFIIQFLDIIAKE